MQSTGTRATSNPEDAVEVRRVPGLVVLDGQGEDGARAVWIVPQSPSLANSPQGSALIRQHGGVIGSDGQIVVDDDEDRETLITELSRLMVALAVAPRSCERNSLPEVSGIASVERDGRVEINFAHDGARIARLEAMVPCRWSTIRRCWLVDSRDRESVRQWLTDELTRLEAANDGRQYAQAMAMIRQVDGGERVPESWVQPCGGVRITSQYDEKLNSLLKTAGARWDKGGRAWVIRFESIEKSLPILPAIADRVAERTEPAQEPVGRAPDDAHEVVGGDGARTTSRAR